MSAKDISRFLFQPQKRYSSVRMQQGRVILDSDWNESERIDDEEARRTVVETVCAKGTPNEGFLVQEVTEATVTEPPAVGEEVPSSKATYDFALGSGSFYLGGLRFEIFTEIVADGPDLTERFLTQADWLQIDADLGNLPARPSVADLTNADGSFKVRHDLVYVRGWEQCVTAVEDSELRERALGGPDTSVRLRRMRRIEVLPEVDLDPARQDFCDAAFAALKAQLTAPREGDLTDEHHLFDEANCELRSKAKLTITFGGEGITDDPCKPKVTAGFLGADNQTIRVQLTATNRFIWGYDNASPLYRVQVLEEAGQPVKIKFLTLPHDQGAQPLKGQAVEILPWGALLPNQEKVAELQGHLATVATSFNPEDKTMTISTPVPQAWIDWLHAPEHAQYLSDRDPDAKKKYFYLRLWTGGSGDADQPDHAFTPGTPVELLGTGLNVTFSKPGLPGDFWIIAARPNTPDLVAPWDLLKEAPPAGTRFFFAPLALVRWTVTIPPAGGEVGVRATVVDCRHTFRPLCEVDGGGTVPAPELTHIIGLSWTHDEEMQFNDFINLIADFDLDNLTDPRRTGIGLVIMFDQEVQMATVLQETDPSSPQAPTRSEVFQFYVRTALDSQPELLYEGLVLVPRLFHQPVEVIAVDGAGRIVEIAPRPGQERAKAVRLVLPHTDVSWIFNTNPLFLRIVFRADFALDINDKAVDGNHIGGLVPQRSSGNGRQGDTFESWFTVLRPA